MTKLSKKWGGGGWGVREKRAKAGKREGSPLPSLPNPPPFFPSSLSPTPFDDCYAGETKFCRKLLHSRIKRKSLIIIQIQEALWRKSNNLRNPYLAVMKSLTFHKRSKRMLLHQRANQCRPAITAENQYACYDLSLRNKRKNRICSVKT